MIVYLYLYLRICLYETIIPNFISQKKQGLLLKRTGLCRMFLNICFLLCITMWNFRQKSLQQFNLIKQSINYILDHQHLVFFSTSFHCGMYTVYWVNTTGSLILTLCQARQTRSNVIQILYKMTEPEPGKYFKLVW